MGIVGIIVFALIVVYLLLSVFKMLWIYNQRTIDEKRVLSPLYFSAMFLIFFLLYGITGNCLYDKTSPFFYVVCGIIMGYMDWYRKEQRLLEKNNTFRETLYGKKSVTS